MMEMDDTSDSEILSCNGYGILYTLKGLFSFSLGRATIYKPLSRPKVMNTS